MMEQSLFVEQIVARKNAPLAMLLFGIMIVLAVLVGFTGLLLIQPVILVLFVILLVLLYFMYLHVNVEYEYSVTDGVLDVDIIHWKRKRKHLISIDVENVVAIAPAGSEPIKAYIGRKMKIHDCTTHEANHSHYTIVFRPQGSADEAKLLFEPNELVLDSLWRKAPSKVHKEA